MTPLGPKPRGPGLADVVEQGGEAGEVVRRAVRLAGGDVADDGDGVGEHVLVPVDRVLLEAHRRDLGQELLEEAGVVQEPQAGRGVVDDEQLVQLVADPLGRHDLEPAGHGRGRGDERGIGREPVAGDEPGGPQHAQRVVGEGLLGRERRAQPAVHEQVGHAVEGIDERRRVAVGVGEQLERHGVDGEVAAGEVGLDGVGEDDLGLAGVRRVGLGPVGGDLEHAAVALDADGAEAGALVPHRVGPAGDDRAWSARAGVGGEVEVEAARAARPRSRSRTIPPTR